VPAGAYFSENAALQLAHTGWVNIANLSVDKSTFAVFDIQWYNLVQFIICANWPCGNALFRIL